MSPLFRFRSVVPDLPAPPDYWRLIEGMHANGRFSNFGPLARRFETELKEMFGAPDECCVTACNATSGLTAALLASGRSGRVLLPAFTFPGSMSAVRSAGMTPVVVDVDAETWTIRPEVLDRALTQTSASAVMLVRPFGMGGDCAAELAVCRAHGAAIVIDNASGLGGARSAQDCAADVFEVFSMHATKPFAIGEGGVVFAHRTRELALRSALNFGLGSEAGSLPSSWGVNGKMSEHHAAVGIAQMRRYASALALRRQAAQAYRDMLSHFPAIACPQDMRAAPWQFFPALLPSAEAAEDFIAAAAALGLEIRRYYRPSLSRWPGVVVHGPCPVAEDLAERMCVLPVRGLTAHAENSQIIALIQQALHQAFRRGP